MKHIEQNNTTQFVSIIFSSNIKYTNSQINQMQTCIATHATNKKKFLNCFYIDKFKIFGNGIIHKTFVIKHNSNDNITITSQLNNVFDKI
jgi:hypothetical protein